MLRENPVFFFLPTHCEVEDKKLIEMLPGIGRRYCSTAVGALLHPFLVSSHYHYLPTITLPSNPSPHSETHTHG